MNRVDTSLGALTAALILMIGQFVALFTENTELTVGDIKQATWIAIVGGGIVAFLKDFNAVSFRRITAGVRGAGGAVNTFVLLIMLGFTSALASCSFLEERPATAYLATTYATLKVIDDDAEKAERVIEIATEVLQLASSDPETTISRLMSEARGLIRWNRLDDADTLLVNALLVEVEHRLREKFGDGIIPEDARLTVQTLAGWVIEAAQSTLDDP